MIQESKHNNTRIKTQQYKDQNTTMQGSKHNNTMIKTQQYKDQNTTIQGSKHFIKQSD